MDQPRSFSGSENKYSLSTSPRYSYICYSEKLEKDQAAMRTDLCLAYWKLKESLEHVDDLEEKLQKSLYEIRLRQKEDEKLWRGLNSKFSSTKALSDQLTETLLHLAPQVEDDAVITNLIATLADIKLNIEDLNSQLEKLHLELTTKKEHEVKYLVSIQKDLVTVQLRADKLLEKLVSSEQEVEKLEDFVHSLGAELAEMDKKISTFMDKFDKLSGIYDTCSMLLQKDRDLVWRHAQRSFDQFQSEATAEKEDIESAGNNLNENIIKLQNDKESLLCQLSGIRCSATQTIYKLLRSFFKNAEAESVISKLKEEIETLLESLKTWKQESSSIQTENKEKAKSFQNAEAESVISKLKEEIETLLESLKTWKQESSSSIQTENKGKAKSFQADALRLSDENLQEEIEGHHLQADLSAKEVNQLQTVIEDRVHLIHHQELRQNEIHAENELKERITALKSEHDVQLKAFECQYEDDYKKLQEELDLQSKKEEGQKSLVQLQWEVMSQNQAEEQEVDSYKESPFVKVTATPVSKTLKKVQKLNTTSIMSIPYPKHRNWADHCEYEVETNNGRVTKRRKTRNKAMPKGPLERQNNIQRYLNILNRLNMSTSTECKPSPQVDLSVFHFDDHTPEAHLADHTPEAHLASLSEGGGRRSTRIKSRPLEYWRGERLLYGRIDESMPTVVGIKYGSPGEERALKVKSFVSEEYKAVVDFAAL